MWNTPYGERTLIGAERQLILTSGGVLSDFISAASECDEGIRYGIVLFDRLTWQQQIMMLEKVMAQLTDPKMPAPRTTALLDATVAVLYCQLLEDVRVELDMARMDAMDGIDSGNNYEMRERILNALTEPFETDEPMEEPPEEGWPSVDCDDIGEWELAVECLRGRILADEDWQMDAITMDLDPKSSNAFKSDLGIQHDYFIDIPPDGSDEEAEAARLRINSLGRKLFDEPDF